MAKIIIENQDCATAIPLGMLMLRRAIENRVRLGLPIYRDHAQSGVFTVDVSTSLLGDYVHIRGSQSSEDNLLLFNGVEVYGYNWTTGAFQLRFGATSAGVLHEGDAEGIALISGIEDGRRLVDKRSQKLQTALENTDVAVHVIARDVVVEGFVSDIYILKGSTVTPFLSVPGARAIVDFAQMSSTGYAITEETVPAWNATRTIEAVRMSFETPANSVFEHRWSPRVYYPELGNAYPLPPARGLFYGSLPTSDIPATSLKVAFGSYFDDRCHDTVNGCEANDFRKGYCEILREKTIAEDGDGFPIPPETISLNTCFFISSLWEPSRTTFYSRPALPAVGYKFVGSSHQTETPDAEFVIDYTGTLVATPEVHWWSALGEAYPEDFDLAARYPLHGILAAADGKWILHRWRGMTQEVASGEGYVSHSVSTNGEFVAIFSGEAGIIQTVIVYNIATNALVVTKAVDRNFTSGVILPTKPLNDIVPVTLPESPAAVVAPETEIVSSLGGFTQIPTGALEAPAYAAGWKLVIDGKEATASVWEDECWAQAKATVLRPDQVSEAFLNDSFFSVVVDGKEYTAQGWANLGAILPNLLWFVRGDGVNNEAGLAKWVDTLPQTVGAVAGSNLSVVTAEREETLTIGLTDDNANGYGEVAVPLNAVAPVVITSDPEDGLIDLGDGTKEIAPGAQCSDLTITIVDSCGIPGELVIPYDTTPFEGVQGADLVPDVPTFNIVGGASPFFIGNDLQYDFFAAADGVLAPQFPSTEDNLNLIAPTRYIGVRPKNQACCGETYPTVSISDDCGNSDSVPLDGDRETYVPITIDTEDVFAIGAEYYAVGGCPPYTWSPSAGISIEDIGDGAGARITAIDPCLAPHTLSVIEGCATWVQGEEGEEMIPWGTSISLGTAPAALSLSGPSSGVNIGSQFTASGGVAPYTYSISSGSIGSSSGTITGISTSNCYQAIVTVTDDCGSTATKNIVFAGITNPGISGPVDSVVVGSSYTASGGTGPYTWSMTNGSINSSGVITALTCTAGNPAYGTITVTDACGKQGSLTVRYSGGVWRQRAFYRTCLSTSSGCSTCAAGGSAFAEGYGSTTVGGMRYWTTYQTSLIPPGSAPQCFGTPNILTSGSGSFAVGPLAEITFLGKSMPSNIGTQVFYSGYYVYLFANSQAVERFEC